jgi:hypothetical protein
MKRKHTAALNKNNLARRRLIVPDCLPETDTKITLISRPLV